MRGALNFGASPTSNIYMKAYNWLLPTELFESLINNQQCLYSFNYFRPSFFDVNAMNFTVNTSPDHNDRMTPQEVGVWILANTGFIRCCGEINLPWYIECYLSSLS